MMIISSITMMKIVPPTILQWWLISEDILLDKYIHQKRTREKPLVHLWWDDTRVVRVFVVNWIVSDIVIMIILVLAQNNPQHVQVYKQRWIIIILIKIKIIFIYSSSFKHKCHKGIFRFFIIFFFRLTTVNWL